MELWTEKYKPQTLDEIIGNSNKLKIVNEWFESFNEVKSKKILLLSGPPGIGKTTVANLALKKYNYNIIEFNASTIRGPKNIRDIFEKVLGYKSIVDMFSNGSMPTGIIMDEIDTLCSGGDKGGMAEFLSIIKSRKNKNVYNINNPIVCTYNDFSDKKLTELKNLSVEVRMTKPCDMDMINLIEKIEKGENMNIDIDAKQIIIKNSMGDIRRMINLLYDIYILHNEETITLEIVDKILKTFVKKDVDVQIFDMTWNVLNTKLSSDAMLNYYDADRLLLPMMIHENYINSIYNRNLDNKFEMVRECSESLIQNDLFQTAIYEHQLWDMSDTTAMSFCMQMNKIGEMKKVITKTDKINYTILLNKISLDHTNKKLINSLNIRLNIDLSFTDIYFLSEIIVYHLFNKNGNKKKLLEIMKQYNLRIDDKEKRDDIGLLLRINRLNSSDINNKYTAKIKREIVDLVKKSKV